MPELDRQSVVLDLEARKYAAGMKTAAKMAQGLASDIEKSGDSAERSARTKTAFGQTSKAIKDAQQQAARGAEFKVRANPSALAGVKRMFSEIYQEAAKGAEFKVRADERGLSEVRTAFSDIRRNAAEGAPAQASTTAADPARGASPVSESPLAGPAPGPRSDRRELSRGLHGTRPQCTHTQTASSAPRPSLLFGR